MVDHPWAPLTLAYGSHRDQFGHLRAPGPGITPVPVAVLLHGGFWRDQVTLTLMDPIADDLARRGLATWNVEYRRADRYGWDTMGDDVGAAVRYLTALAGDHSLDLDRMLLVGHSAGGQLAARVCADLVANHDALRPAVVVSLAGIVDLATAARRDLGDGAVPHAIGGTPEAMPERYAASSPIVRLPLHARLLVVNAGQDDPDLNDMQRTFAAAARAAGDDVVVLEGEGDHFTLIDPHSQLWKDTMTHTAAVLEREAVARHIERLYRALGNRELFDSHLDPAITIWESDADHLLVGLDDLDRLRDERVQDADTVFPTSSVAPENLHVEVWDHTAMAHYLLVAKYQDGALADSRFRVTDVLRRGESGWRIIHHHSEAIDQPQA